MSNFEYQIRVRQVRGDLEVFRALVAGCRSEHVAEAAVEEQARHLAVSTARLVEGVSPDLTASAAADGLRLIRVVGRVLVDSGYFEIADDALQGFYATPGSARL